MKVHLNLDKTSQRPVIFTNQFPGCRALLDTGASFPVWTDKEETLIALGGKFIKDNMSFSGFGGAVNAKLYELTVYVGDIIFPHMSLLFSQNDAIPGYFLFSATMFHNMIYTINNVNHTLEIDTQSNQTAYNLKIIDKNNKLHVLCTAIE
jgi:hypothetical protein